MFSLIENILNGRWFKEPSPFRCKLEKNHSKLCVITGPNASGKSLLRKILHNHHHDKKIEYIVTSQEKRCASSGIERVLIYGSDEDESTGCNSIKTLLKVIKTGKSRESSFSIMLDEPEIGCSQFKLFFLKE